GSRNCVQLLEVLQAVRSLLETTVAPEGWQSRTAVRRGRPRLPKARSGCAFQAGIASRRSSTRVSPCPDSRTAFSPELGSNSVGGLIAQIPIEGTQSL